MRLRHYLTGRANVHQLTARTLCGRDTTIFRAHRHVRSPLPAQVTCGKCRVKLEAALESQGFDAGIKGRTRATEAAPYVDGHRDGRRGSRRAAYREEVAA